MIEALEEADSIGVLMCSNLKCKSFNLFLLVLMSAQSERQQLPYC